MSLAEERAVGAGRLAESWVEGQSRTREVIERRVHGSNLSSVEEVKGLGEHFDFCLFANWEAAGKA